MEFFWKFSFGMFKRQLSLLKEWSHNFSHISHSVSCNLKLCQVYKPSSHWKHNPTSSYQQQFVWAIHQDAPRTFKHGSLHWESFRLHSCTIFTSTKRNCEVRWKEKKPGEMQDKEPSATDPKLMFNKLAAANPQQLFSPHFFHPFATLSPPSNKRYYLPSSVVRHY